MFLSTHMCVWLRASERDAAEGCCGNSSSAVRLLYECSISGASDQVNEQCAPSRHVLPLG